MSAQARPSGPTPKRVAVRMYQVGFGDCFLLSFGYGRELPDGRAERHVLIDFGSTHWPKRKPSEEPSPSYARIAADIAERSGGRLDVLAITHRHTDHLAGFENREIADRIAALKPALVLRPWTEDPAAAAKARGPAPPRRDSRRFAASLESAQAFAAEVEGAIASEARGLRSDLRGFAAQQLANRAAIKNIDRIAKQARSGARYLHAGAESGIEELIPGVKTVVVGPPSVEQWPEVAGQRENDPEYWDRERRRLAMMLSGSVPGEEPAAAVGAVGREAGVEPGPARWLVERMRAQQGHSLMRIVRALDDALNNTSLVLLFEAGGRRLLFPGDAQIENWSYVLTGEDEHPQSLRSAARLEQIDLYKVGHHGSRNATPRSLVGMWKQHGSHVTSLMSTLPGVHGESEETEVPRRILVKALDAVGTVRRTDRLRAGELFLEVSASTADRKPFALERRRS